jgi:hypothetical protein
MTIIYTTRWLKFSGEPDFSIIQDSQPIEIDQEFEDFLKTNPLGLGGSLHLNVPIKYYSSTKAGPNGPALMSAL